MVRRFSEIFAFAASFACLIGTAHASIVTNGSFEDNGFAPAQGYENVNFGDSTTLNGWTVVGQPTRSTPITWINNNDPFGSATASDGSYFLDLTGFNDGEPFGGVSQTLATTAGDVYKLTFDLGYASQYGAPVGITATAGSTSQAFTSPSTAANPLWVTETMFFTATGSSTTLSLIGNLGGAYIGLDNVAVNFDHVFVSATPLPAALPLFAGGLGMLGLIAGRKKRKAAMAAAA